MIIQGLQENTLRNRKIHHSDSATLRHYLRIQPQLELCDGVLHRKTYTTNHRTRGVKLQIILPKSLIKSVMAGCHDQFGHQVKTALLVLSEEDSIGILCTEILPTMLVNVLDALEGKAKLKELPCNLSLLHNQ